MASLNHVALLEGDGQPPTSGFLTVEQLESACANGQLDTILLALPDMEGRLQGKRLTARHFLDDVVSHGAEACAYLLATDVEMDALDGYAIAGWSSGFDDIVLKPDLGTLRCLPWAPATALVICDAFDKSGRDIAVAPRQVLQRQLARLADRGLRAYVSTELEFLAFRATYRAAQQQRYVDLEPATPYNSDYALLDTCGTEAFVGRVRRSMEAAGMVVEGSKGECNQGQHEINLRYDAALRMADNHVVYKHGVKEIAALEAMSVTFMAKFDEGAGSSCHIHLSLVDEDDNNAFARDSNLLDQFLAGQLACMRELTLLFAPQVNSYKRFVPGMFAPTAVAWGRDNRTCSLRLLGDGPALRIENRLAGADVNPYLGIAAMVAAGLHGLDSELELEQAVEGNAYASDKPHVPSSLEQAADGFSASAVAIAAFGQDVVDHYVTRARHEATAFGRAVTDWERIRGFERL